MEFKILDLFSGAGGFSSGFEQHKDFKTSIAVDFDQNALKTFKFNFPNTKIICGDLTSKEVKSQIIETAKQEKINMIIGGPPCQGFSLKGKLKGLDDPRNFLFLEYYNLVKELKPEVFVIENVKNLLNTLDGYFIKQIYDKFTNLGYQINYGILNAKDFGVPQKRERAIIIGSLSKNINLPIKNTEKIVTVKDAISDLNYLESSEGSFESKYLFKSQSEYQQMLRGDKLFNHQATNHSQIALEKLKMIPAEGNKNHLPKELWGKQRFNTTWSRLKWNEFSPTIDTRFDTPSNGKNSHPVLNRSITPREAARLQSFHDSFVFLGPKTSICRQIGNAVPPFLAKAIATQIANSYNQKEKENNYKLYNGDAYKIVDDLIENKIMVDHIICDPPYNISKENNFSTLNSPRKGILFGQWDQNFDLFSWIPKYVQLLDNNGSIIIFCSYKYMSFIIKELENSKIEVKDVLVWQKSNPMPRNINRRYVQDMEFAIWGVKQKAKWIFNKPKEKPYLRSLFEFPIVSGKEKVDHPTQKSLKLMEEIIKIHTNEGDLILDPFMGSGTTGVAALKLKRNFIGIEKDEKYFKITKERIEKINIK
ncbi:DNA (cytosine-5-)-methyltransferase [Mycoplasma sp. CB776]